VKKYCEGKVKRAYGIGREKETEIKY